MALLAWVKSKKQFLKIQEGTGDNLSREDIAQGMKDYVLWSTFRPESIDVDQELEMELLGGGELMLKELATVDASIPDCYEQAFNASYDCNDIVVLMHDDDCE
jgi:hypothetical protein